MGGGGGEGAAFLREILLHIVAQNQNNQVLWNRETVNYIEVEIHPSIVYTCGSQPFFAWGTLNPGPPHPYTHSKSN